MTQLFEIEGSGRRTRDAGDGGAPMLEPPTSSGLRPPLLSVVICTLDESDSIGAVLMEASAALAGVRHELIVVDDSADERTAQAVLAMQPALPKLKLVRRPGERGLSAAVIAGWAVAEGSVFGVMDGDGQPDPAVLRRLLSALQGDEADLAVGSRYMDGPSGLKGFRAFISEAGTAMTGLLLGLKLRDPLSGLFLVRREWVEQVKPRLSGIGFKILIDTIASGKTRPVVAQVPTALRPRASGHSKLDLRIAAELAALLIEKRTGGWVRARFVLFATVGLSGVAVNLAAQALARRLGAGSFALAEAAAILAAMLSNFALNNVLTFRDRRLRGSAFWRGLMLFCLSSTGGAVLGELAAVAAYRLHFPWLACGIVGAAAGASINYVGATRLSWRRRTTPAAPHTLSEPVKPAAEAA